MPLLSDRGGSFISCKTIAAVRTVKVYIAQLTAQSPLLLEAMMDLDTHANNTVLGGSCLLIHDSYWMEGRCLGVFISPRVD